MPERGDAPIELCLLGLTELRRDDEDLHSFIAGPKRLALLVYLALHRPRSFQRRDALLPLFWPESGQKAARNALSNMLYHMRRGLGEGVITSRGAEEVGVQTGQLWVDVIAFEEALDRGDLREALELYQGDLMEGFHVPGAAPAFDHWLGRERDRLRRCAAEGAWALAEEAEGTGRVAAAQTWAKEAASRAPLSEEAQMRLIELLARTGDRAGAMATYESFAGRLRQEWEIEPSEAMRTLVGRIRTSAGPPLTRPAPAQAKEPDERSIAILPFQSLGAEESAFTHGIHGGLQACLSGVSDLQVISRTSTRKYRRTDKSIPEIGSELAVSWVLEGEVQEATGEVQVTVRLVRAATDRQVWARDYRRRLTAENIFRIQGEIADEIARSLEAKLTPKEKRRLEKQLTEDLEAYRLYQHGRASLDRRTETGIRQALDWFQRALQRDSRYALAWAGLAEALALFQFYGLVRPADAPEALGAAHRAVELAPDLGEAHAALGILRAVHREGPAALRELRRAMELAPSYVETYIWLGWLELCLGRPAEALEPAKRAVTLNPLAPAFRAYLAEIHLANGAGQEALHEARRAREIQPTYGLARYMEGLVLYHLGRHAEATSAVREALSLAGPSGTPTRAEVQALLALTHVANGNDERAHALLAQIEETAAAFSIGLVRAALGQIDAAFDAFSKVQAWGSFETEHVRYFFPSVLAPVREDGRYEQLLSEVNCGWEPAQPCS